MAEFETVFKEHAPMIGRIAASYERRPEIVEELVQDCAVALLRALPAFRGDGALKAYVARIAHNVCVSHVRRAAAHKTTTLDETEPARGPQPDEVAARSIERDRLLEAVRGLPTKLRQPIVLYLEGFGQTEIAEALGVSATAAGARLTRARAALRDAIGDAR